MSQTITIEPLSAPDVSTVATWLSVPETNQWLTTEWRGRTIDPVVMGIVIRNKKNRLFLSRSDGNACGIVAFADIEPIDKTAMVWYILGNKDVGGRGVTSTALRQLVDLGFGELGLESLYAWIIQDNLPSRRVLEKLGFREAGRIRRAVCRDGAQLDRQYFDLVKEDLASK